MLTKDLLRYRLRSGKLKPLFVDSLDSSVRGFIDLALNTYRESLHQRREDLEQELEIAQQVSGLEPKLAHGILKVIDRHAEYDSLKNEDFRKARLAYLKTISALRRAASQPQSDECFGYGLSVLPEKNLSEILEFEKKLKACALGNPQEPFGAPTTEPFSDFVHDNLFADLPSQDKLTGAPDLSTVQIVNRYNIALVQGLLLSAKRIRLQIFDESLTNRRRLFSYMKFFGITAKEISFASGRHDRGIFLELEGPLSVLDSSKTYAFQLSCFFPAILQLEDWSLEVAGTLSRDSRDFSLSLDPTLGLSPYFEQKLSYRPEEISVFKDSFNSLASEWQVMDCAELIQLENGDHCLPDFIFTRCSGGEDGNKSPVLHVYLEVFFTWNKSVLLQRLAAPQRIHSSSQCQSEGALLLAFDKKLLKAKEVDCFLKAKELSKESSQDSRASIAWLTFSQFLSPKVVLKILKGF